MAVPANGQVLSDFLNAIPPHPHPHSPLTDRLPYFALPEDRDSRGTLASGDGPREVARSLVKYS